MAGLISRRYAEALFQLALEKDCVDKYSDEIKLIHDTLAGNGEILKVLNNPEISSDIKMNILKDAFEKYVSEDVLGLLAVVFRKNREKELIDILSEFLGKVMEYRGIVYATVESAVPLKSEKINEIKQKLSKKLNKQVEVEVKIVPELIGGIKIAVDGYVIDNTVKKGIEAIKKALLEIKLAQ